MNEYPETEQNKPKPAVDALGASLRAEFEEIQSLRLLYEERWIKDLRQYKGVYDPEVLERIGKNRSKVFMRATKVKCDTIKARLMDLLFPANGEKNWGIQPTPEPTIHPMMIDRKAAELVEQGMSPENVDVDAIVRGMAKECSDKMSREIADQLMEAPDRPSYRGACGDMIAQTLRYGTGVFKGPLVEQRVRGRYEIDERGNWVLQKNHTDADYRPYYEFVPIWNIYPDMSVADPRRVQFVWQEHLMSAQELADLSRMPNFDKEAIREYILAHKSGDADPKIFETNLRTISDLECSPPDMKGKFRVHERWGYIEGHKLVQYGVKIPEEQLHESFSTNVWIVGNRVIKCVLNPLEGIPVPYHFFFYDKDESSFFGNGVPTVMRDCQSGINASVRLALDNSAISSGPQIGVNVRALTPGTDPTDVYPWKVWPFKNSADVRSAFQVFELPSNANELLGLSKMFSEFADELTTPRFMQGSTNNVKGAGETASGLSMLMGAANINLKDLVKGFDDNITRPFITAMYHWNMQFNEDQEIKGDFDVMARGSSALIAKEIQAQRMTQAVALTDNPRFQGRVKDDEFLAEIFKSMDLDAEYLRDENEFRDFQQQQMTMEVMAQAEATVQAVVAEMQKEGIDPQQALTQMLAQAQQQVAPAQEGQVAA